MTTEPPADLATLIEKVQDDLETAIAGTTTTPRVLVIRRMLFDLEGQRRREHAGQLPPAARKREHALLRRLKADLLPNLRQSILDAAPVLDIAGGGRSQSGDLIERASLHAALEKWVRERGDMIDASLEGDRMARELQKRIVGYRKALEEVLAGPDTPDIERMAQSLFGIEVLVWCLEELDQTDTVSVARHESRRIARMGLQSVTTLFESFNSEKSLWDRFDIAVVTSDVDHLVAILTRLFDVEQEELEEGADPTILTTSVQAVEDFLAAAEGLNDNFVRTIESAAAKRKVDTELFAGAVKQIEKIQTLSRQLAHQRAEKTAAMVQDRCRSGLVRVCNRLHALAKAEIASEKPDTAVLSTIGRRVEIVEALIRDLQQNPT